MAIQPPPPRKQPMNCFAVGCIAIAGIIIAITLFLGLITLITGLFYMKKAGPSSMESPSPYTQTRPGR